MESLQERDSVAWLFWCYLPALDRMLLRPVRTFLAPVMVERERMSAGAKRWTRWSGCFSKRCFFPPCSLLSQSAFCLLLPPPPVQFKIRKPHFQKNSEYASGYGSWPRLHTQHISIQCSSAEWAALASDVVHLKILPSRLLMIRDPNTFGTAFPGISQKRVMFWWSKSAGGSWPKRNQAVLDQNKDILWLVRLSDK